MSALLAIAEKYWKPLVITLLVAFSLWRAYSFGVDSTNSTWNLKWSQRDLVDSTAALHAEVAERTEERRRQQAADEERKRADEELAKVQADADAARRAGRKKWLMDFQYPRCRKGSQRLHIQQNQHPRRRCTKNFCVAGQAESD